MRSGCPFIGPSDVSEVLHFDKLQSSSTTLTHTNTMANTYKKIYIHLVFAVKNRDAILAKEWRGKLFAYIAGIVKKRGHYSLAVNGHHDHVHILFDYNCKELISDLVREIKKASAAYIKEEKLTPFKFNWQSGYGAFSVGWRDKSKIITYIENQEEHHKDNAFREEYFKMLALHEIEFKEEYVFEFL